MSIDIGQKINQLTKKMPEHTVVLSSWLKQQGISDQLVKRYRSSQWLEPVGHGAYQRTGSPATWMGALYALQSQACAPVHAGGPTAFALHGRAHYIAPDLAQVWLFSPPTYRLPAWFARRQWKPKPHLVRTAMLPLGIGLQQYSAGSFSITVSSSARAMMECLQLAPHRFSLMECYELMQNLPTLRVSSVQQLLQSCASVKVVRLFMFMAERAGHSWVDSIDRSRLDFGRGKRTLARDGVYNAKYQLVLPAELA